jgi:hypothetical protein
VQGSVNDDNDFGIVDDVHHQVSHSNFDKASAASSTNLSDLYADSDDEDGCMVCGFTTGWRTLVQCDFCSEYIHLVVVNQNSLKFQRGNFFVVMLAESKKLY